LGTLDDTGHGLLLLRRANLSGLRAITFPKRLAAKGINTFGGLRCVSGCYASAAPSGGNRKFAKCCRAPLPALGCPVRTNNQVAARLVCFSGTHGTLLMA